MASAFCLAAWPWRRPPSSSVTSTVLPSASLVESGSTLEVDVLVVGHVEVVLVLVIVGLHFLVGVGEAVDVVLLIVGGQNGVLQNALKVDIVMLLPYISFR